MSKDWNHNIQYHRAALSAVPHPCEQALDIGCGNGSFTRKLAKSCEHVTAIDLDAEIIATAANAEPVAPNVTFVVGDIMTSPLPPGSFTYLGSIATLHHLPLGPAFIRFRGLLAPGGVLMIIGLYRPESLQDQFWQIVGFLASFGMRRTHHFSEVTAPTRKPSQTLAQIEATAETHLPGSVLKRRLFFRYSLIWRKA